MQSLPKAEFVMMLNSPEERKKLSKSATQNFMNSRYATYPDPKNDSSKLSQVKLSGFF